METYPKYVVQDIILSQDGPLILLRPAPDNDKELNVEKGKTYFIGASPVEDGPVPEFNR